jgi:hypothetical protein
MNDVYSIGKILELLFDGWYECYIRETPEMEGVLEYCLNIFNIEI